MLSIWPLQVCAVHMSLISQLERLGGVEEWALYVALHLPDGADVLGGSARDDLVLQLLHRHAPVWAASQEKQEFLVKALGLPPSWLATALATFASYNNDLEGASALSLCCAPCPGSMREGEIVKYLSLCQL